MEDAIDLNRLAEVVQHRFKAVKCKSIVTIKLEYKSYKNVKDVLAIELSLLEI